MESKVVLPFYPNGKKAVKLDFAAIILLKVVLPIMKKVS